MENGKHRSRLGYATAIITKVELEFKGVLRQHSEGIEQNHVPTVK